MVSMKQDINETTDTLDHDEKVSYGATSGLEEGVRRAGAAAPKTGPSVLAVHSALVAGYCMFAGGAIVGKFGVHGSSPIIFELWREVFSFFGLAAGIYINGKSFLPEKEDVPRLLLGGFAFFCNQVFWFVALKISDPVTGSAWQTFLPILTAMLAVMLGQTTVAGMKALGILTSAAGAVFMVVFDTRKVDDTHNSMVVKAIGHLIFFGNILGTSAYFVIQNRFGSKYSPWQTTTWSLFISVVILFCVALVTQVYSSLLDVLCHSEMEKQHLQCVSQGWSLPPSVYFPLGYEVIVCTLMAWPLLNWANQFTDPAVVTVYMGVHPVAVTIICIGIVGVQGLEWAAQFHIGMPHFKDIGILLIVAGLMVVFYSERARRGEGPVPTVLAKAASCSKKV